jgi:pimeloyl-ACP methyl ester carboxylesterase
MPATLSENVLQRDGCPLHYGVAGPENRPLVVFTHGACVDCHTFDSHWPVVAEQYRVLVWDVRGHGRSRPMGAAYSLARAVADLLAILDTIQSGPAIFVGHSNGGYIAQEIAFHHPHRVLGLVLANGTCITWPRDARRIRRARFLLRTIDFLPIEWLKRIGLRMGSTRPEVRAYAYRAFSQLPPADFRRILHAVGASIHPEPGYRCGKPMLLIHGEHERWGDIVRLAPLWVAHEPRCRFVAIPGARHFALMDDAPLFNRLLLEFLAECAPV